MNNPTSTNAGTQWGPTGQANTPVGGATGKSPQGNRVDADSVKDQAKRQVDSAKRQAVEVTDQAKQGLREATDRAKETGKNYAADKKRQAGGEIGVFSDAIRSAAETLHEENHDSVACYADAAAEQLDRLRDTIESRSSREWVHDARNLIHRRPEIVYGGLFVAGLAMMRFLKASSPNHAGTTAGTGSNARNQEQDNPSAARDGRNNDKRNGAGRSTSQPVPRPYSPATMPSSPVGPSGTSGTSSDVEISRATTVVEKPKGDK